MAKKYNPFLVSVGETIRKKRKQKQLSQMKLAESVGGSCSGNSISAYENGEKEMGILRLIEISDALEVSPAVLLGSKEDILTVYSQLDEENQTIIKKQMEALLLMQQTKEARNGGCRMTMLLITIAAAFWKRRKHGHTEGGRIDGSGPVIWRRSL